MQCFCFYLFCHAVLIIIIQSSKLPVQHILSITCVIQILWNEDKAMDKQTIWCRLGMYVDPLHTSSLAFSLFWGRRIEFSISTFSGLVLLSLLLSPSYLFLQHHSTSFSVVLPFGVHRLPCSHYYIFFSLSLHTAQPSQSRFSYFLTYLPHLSLCSYFFIPDLLNPLYAHHLYQHSRFCSF